MVCIPINSILGLCLWSVGGHSLTRRGRTWVPCHCCSEPEFMNFTTRSMSPPLKLLNPMWWWSIRSIQSMFFRCPWAAPKSPFFQRCRRRLLGLPRSLPPTRPAVPPCEEDEVDNCQGADDRAEDGGFRVVCLLVLVFF